MEFLRTIAMAQKQTFQKHKRPVCTQAIFLADCDRSGISQPSFLHLPSAGNYLTGHAASPDITTRLRSSGLDSGLSRASSLSWITEDPLKI